MIKFAIVGCGRVAHEHAKAINGNEESKLIAVCDSNYEKVKGFSETYHGKIYTDFDEMLENNDIQVVNICTPNGLHAEMAIKAMEKGKHVTVEKPIAITVEDCNRIIETANRMGVKAAAVHQNRFNPAVLTTRKALEEGKFGKMSHGVASTRWFRDEEYYSQGDWRGTKEMADGILMNQCIHNIDLLIWMMGPVKKVTGKTATRLRDIEMEDVGAAILEFESGALGIVEGAGTIYPTDLEATINLFGEDGTVLIGGTAMNRLDRWSFRDENEKEELVSTDNPPTVYGYGHKEIVKDMIGAIKEDREPYVSLEAGKNAVEIVLAIYESSKTGLPVYLTR